MGGLLGAATLLLGCGSAFETSTGTGTGGSGQGGASPTTTTTGGGGTSGGGGHGSTSGGGGHGGTSGGGGTTTGSGGGATGGGGAGGAGGCQPGTIETCYSGPVGTRGVGVCVGGQRLCDVQGKFGACLGEVMPSSETCNGKDDNCNGATDELPPVTCGLGECRVTVAACTKGAPTPCVPKAPQASEICDGTKDENCNGSVDEGCGCTNGDTKLCYSGPFGTAGTGLCKAGTQACAGGQWGLCVGEVTPKAEECNGKDDDCNGAVDEGNPGSGAPCSTGLPGVCAAGVTACSGGVLQCAQAVKPAAETCNGKDDDCNGAVDDGNPGGGAACSTGKLGVCAVGAMTCAGGALVCQQTVGVSDETCNGKDDDCDGVVDDGNPGGGAACSTGLLGVCAAGTMTCKAGSVTCVQTTPASVELCNKLDDNCDGIVDEGNPEGGTLCITTGGKGACAVGSLKCSNGKLLCLQVASPVTEVCNGIDDDCNGIVDDVSSVSTCVLPMPCNMGTSACQGGAPSCQAATPEVCGNKLDDDCDGIVDQVVYFKESFANNAAGWTLGPEWQIAPATASSGQTTGNPDPSVDHTVTADNGVAGVVPGGNATTAQHGFYYLTSPAFDATGKGLAYLEYWRWLNTDNVPFMTNSVEVFDGAKWVVVWSAPSNVTLADAQWVRMTHGITPYRNAAMRVRFGVAVQTPNAMIASSWNLDDVLVSSGPCP